MTSKAGRAGQQSAKEQLLNTLLIVEARENLNARHRRTQRVFCPWKQRVNTEAEDYIKSQRIAALYNKINDKEGLVEVIT